MKDMNHAPQMPHCRSFIAVIVVASVFWIRFSSPASMSASLNKVKRNIQTASPAEGCRIACAFRTFVARTFARAGDLARPPFIPRHRGQKLTRGLPHASQADSSLMVSALLSRSHSAV